MRAIVQERYGGTLRLADVDPPVVAPDEVLVQVRAASVHPDVWHLVSGRPYVLRLMGAGVRRPKCPVPGTDLAGVVSAVGSAVTGFRPGDEVFGDTVRGNAWRNGGAFAEYAVVPMDALAHKPPDVTFEQAASVPTTGYIALINLPLGRVGPDRRVLVNGAAGGVGAIALQVAKAHGAHVTGVDHPRKLDLVRSLGADAVVDYTRSDFTRGDDRYDLIVDIPGNHPLSSCRRVLTPDGAYVLIGHDAYGQTGRAWLGSLPRFGRLLALTPFVPALRAGAASRLSKKDVMARLRGHLAAGELTPVVDRTFPLAETADALRYLTTGQPVGRVVVVP